MSVHPGYYVVELMNEDGMTINEYADSLQIDPSYLKKVINKKALLSQDLIQKLAARYGMDVKTWYNLQNKFLEKKD